MAAGGRQDFQAQFSEGKQKVTDSDLIEVY